MPKIIIFDDLVGPVLSTPTDTATGSDTANLGVDTTKDNGTLYWVVSTSATAPSEAQIQAGQDHTGAAAVDSDSASVTALGTQSFAATGLTESTTYYAHFVHVDVSANVSNVASGDGFTTDPAGDTTAPVLSSPTGTGTAQTTGTLGVTTDEDNGTIYWVVTTSNTAPSKAQVKAGQDHTGAAAAFNSTTAVFSTGAKTKGATGLTANTQYYMHAMHEDAAANQSDVVSSAFFYTAPSNQTLSTPGTANFTMPAAAPYFKLTVTVNGAGGGGQGGTGGTGGDGQNEFTADCEPGDDGDNGSSGSAGGQTVWDTTLIGNGGSGGTSVGDGSAGTASGGDTNTTGGGASGGSGGNGGDGDDGCGTCGDGSAGGDGNRGGNGGRAVKVYPVGTYAASELVPRTVGAGGNGGNGGAGGDGGSGDPGCDGGDGDNGSSGISGTNGSISLAWSV